MAGFLVSRRIGWMLPRALAIVASVTLLVAALAPAVAAKPTTSLGHQSRQKITRIGTTGLRLDWAHPLGSYNDPNVDSNTFYVQLLQNF